MLHHFSLGTVDLARSTAFYDAVPATPGYARAFVLDPDGHRPEAVIDDPQ
ncbi:MAG TPA: hypothetical protein VEN29_05340 [Casimicrobiaceae bacterium]|nr:hypothetical protein [Casimicrobiaceae bacterium]